MRISKVYTRNGDEGRTRLAGGQEVFKSDPRVETYGTIDELNGVIGAARAFIADHLQENTQLTLQTKSCTAFKASCLMLEEF